MHRRGRDEEVVEVEAAGGVLQGVALHGGRVDGEGALVVIGLASGFVHGVEVLVRFAAGQAEVWAGWLAGFEKDAAVWVGFGGEDEGVDGVAEFRWEGEEGALELVVHYCLLLGVEELECIALCDC